MDQWWVTPAAIAAVAIVGGLATLIYWMGQVQEHRGSVSKFMEEIRDDIKKIFERLPPVPVAGSSPLRLTDFGDRIAAWLKADAWAAGLAPELRSQLEGKAPFEIDRFSREHVREHLAPEWRERVAACAYEFGTGTSGVLDVLQVVLRDELLKLLGHESDPPS